MQKNENSTNKNHKIKIPLIERIIVCGISKKKLNETEFVKPFSLVFGNEATGLDDSFLSVGTSVIIAHSDRIDSLNLPIAASIAMYEATKSSDF